MLPGLEEQYAIASILGRLDDKIELNGRMNEMLETMARALFKSWFVEFDPVHTKEAGHKPGFAKPVADLFPDRLEQSAIGEIPVGWLCSPIGQWADALSGQTPPKDDPRWWGGDIPWISPKSMTSIHADAAEEHVTSLALDRGLHVAPPLSTLVMVRGMGLHEKVRVSQVRGEVVFNQDVKALVPRHVEPSLLFFALLHAQAVLLGQVESSGHGTGRLPSDILLGHLVALPPIDSQRTLARPFDMINDRIARARAETRTLVALRDLLLPRLTSGELRVPQAEQMLSAAPV
jgi:type I restriction enzyme S subunit